ncbi:MAG: hypothetical protein QOH47_2179 [Sphingomonadales bacterium]|jgi:predicted Fe-S protein YdhL (DUF1289 family)|nr:hypothetical protein [Sphingomonadales bacterium]
MAFFPKIQSPCPYKADLASVMDGDFCRMCERRVFDLTHMTDIERRAFMAGCSEEVCVSYRFGPAIAAAALAAAAVPTAAAAQDLGPAVPSAASIAASTDQIAAMEEIEIMVGGIKDLANVDYVEDRADSTIPELPVVYEDASAAQDAPAAAGAQGQP